MSLKIQMLGPPRVDDAEVGLAPRGRKTWAVLAYLILADLPPSRQMAAQLLFPEADDPLGALRWTLSDLRRLLGGRAAVTGDPLRLVLPAGATVDVDVLTRGSWVEAVRLPGLGRELLEGLRFASCPAFELWLGSTRRHLDRTSENVLREAVLAGLARGEPADASVHARRLVTFNPYDENHHVLLVRTLTILGRHEEAADHIERCTELFRRELGMEPSTALRRAAVAPSAGHQGDTHATISDALELGEAAVAAGSAEPGISGLRQAVSGARRLGDQRLLAASLVALGAALVHAARGTDEEGAAALYEAGSLADQVGDAALGATARREMAWIEFLRARYDSALGWLGQAGRLAAGDAAELAWVDATTGGCHLDSGDYPAALAALRSGLDHAERAEARQAGAVAATFLGRWHLLRGELAQARPILQRAMELAAIAGWTTFLPLPESFLAETELRDGDVDAAAARFEHAYAVGCQIGDACWESMAARGLGLVAEARDDIPAALHWLADAPRRCRRLPDTWLWAEAYALEALCRVAVTHGAPSAPTWIAELEALAGRSGMRELLARATLHRARLGDIGALEVAALLVDGIDNPRLASEFTAALG